MTAIEKTDVVSAMALTEDVVKVCDCVGRTSAYHPLRSGPGSAPGSQKELGQGVLRPGLWPVAVIPATQQSEAGRLQLQDDLEKACLKIKFEERI